MPEETKKKLQEIIDHDFELAKKQVEELHKKDIKTANLTDTFTYFVCWDLARQFGLDLKGVIPE